MGTRPYSFVIRYAIFAIIFLLCAAALVFAARRAGTDRSAPAIAQVRRTLVVDAGHGGIDGGASGVSGALEKDLNLEISSRMYALLKLCGADCVMTRTRDEMLSLPGATGNAKGRDIRSRMQIARQFRDPLLVSVHMNSYPLEKYRGLQVFYGASSPLSREAAARIQSRCAELLQPDNDRKIKPAHADIYLLYNADFPAVLVECGFLSNPDEEAALRTEEYQIKLAGTVVSALLELTD